jgi:choline dehydrogenase-like flavoprotein
MKDKKRMTADALVVGTGPGGATVARDLTLKGKKVIMLERGPDAKPIGNSLAMYKFLGGARNFHKGYMISRELTVMVRCLATGGSTMMYTGTAWDPPEKLFEKYDINLSNEAKEIKEELGVQTVPDELIGPGAKIITQSARDLGFNWEKIQKFLTVENCKTNCNSCYYGCKHGAKWHARDWAIDAVNNGAVLMNDTHCDEVIFEGKTATGVRATDKGGQEYEISANAVILAAGGVGTPAIIQRSGIYEAGRKFFVDPFVLTYGYIDKKLIPKKELAMVMGTHLDDEGIVLTDMMAPSAINKMYAMMALKFPKTLKSKGMLCIMAKIRDDLDGMININEIISKPLTKDDLYKLNKGKAISRKILYNAGARDIWHAVAGAAHPGGTCGIGCIVDKDLHTEYKNLYISDASVIPEPWGIPPVLTIICLARRLSKQLASKV